MDLSLTSAQQLIRDSARDFLATETPRSFVKEIDETDTGFSQELWIQMSEMGWVGMIIPNVPPCYWANLMNFIFYFKQPSKKSWICKYK